MKKVRLSLIAAAVLLSIGGAYATKNTTKVGDSVYGVLGTDGDNYIVTSNLTGSSCTMSSNACKIQSADSPDENGEIPKDDATVSSTGTFHQ